MLLSAAGLTRISNGTASAGPGEGATDPSSGVHDPDHLNTIVEQAATYCGLDVGKVVKTTGTVVWLCTVNREGGGVHDAIKIVDAIAIRRASLI